MEEHCRCGEVHSCVLCPPDEAAAVKLAARWGLNFTLTLLHKGHYVKLRSNGELGGAGPNTIQLWHALVKCNQLASTGLSELHNLRAQSSG